MAVLVYILVLLALTGHSSAAYCVCKDGGSDQNLQKALDYACGNGADCSLILQNGACYNPNTVKNHCDYAVNSYFQKKNQAVGSCDFSGVATQSQTPPAGQTTSCVYPASPGQSGGSNSTTPGTTPSTTPSTTPPGTTTPSTTPTTTPGTTTPSTTPSSTTPGTTTPGTTFGISPTGTTTTGINDSSGSLVIFQGINLVFVLALTFVCLLLWE